MTALPSRALVTFGVGAHVKLLKIALPSFESYAARHGYELIVAEPAGDRPASWLKVPALLDALEDHDEVLWLDADVVIVDGSVDIATRVPSRYWQALAMHNSPFDGEHPNHGVWLVRWPMVPALERIWGMTQYLDHPWWEQAASLELLGYIPSRPVRLAAPTRLLRRTMLLGAEWNALPGASVPRPRFMHSAARADRPALMRGWAASAADHDGPVEAIAPTEG